MRTPYLKYTNAELDAALWEIVLHTRKLEALVRDVIQYSGPDDLGAAGSPPIDAGPVNLPSTGSGRAEEAGVLVGSPASSPVCRFGQGDQQRDYFGGPIL